MASVSLETQPRLPPRNRKLKATGDPFFDLPLPSTKPPASTLNVPRTEQESGRNDEPESLFTRLVLSPLLFISFLLSLFLVNRRDRLYRVSEHQRSSQWSFPSLQAWLDPEPYQEMANPQEPTDESKASQPRVVKVKKRVYWFTRKRHKEIFAMEFGDAFEMSGRMILALVAIIGLSVMLMVWFIKKILS